MVSALHSRLPDQAVHVQALAGAVRCALGQKNFTVIVPLSTQVYKWLLAGNPAWTSIPSRGK